MSENSEILYVKQETLKDKLVSEYSGDGRLDDRLETCYLCPEGFSLQNLLVEHLQVAHQHGEFNIIYYFG